MNEPQWVQFAMPNGKRKRAELACFGCHSKKIRCDLQSKRNQGQDSCSNCLSAGKDCRPRPSRRNKGRPPAEIEVARNSIRSSHERTERPRNESPQVHIQTNIFDINPDAFIQSEWPLHSQGPVSESLVGTATSMPTCLEPNWIPSSTGQQLHNVQVDCGLSATSQDNSTTRAEGSAARTKARNSLDVSQLDLRQSFSETYFEYCYTWCPVLDRSTLSEELAWSPLLDNALSLVGSHVRPPLIPQTEPATYYDRARRLFYDDEEENLIISLKAVSLFYWWAPQPPSVVNKHSSWWWTSVIIKHAQQAGFHRESTTDQTRADPELSRKRRIWWTAFARERLTAICQGKPCIIDFDDCNIPPPSLEDFPDVEERGKAEVFIHWVRLCTVIGRIAKELSRSANSTPSTPFPVNLCMELVEWVRSLPRHLHLPIGSSHTTGFNRDVHQLHLPYLAVIVVLHLTRSAQSLPQVLPPATLAGSCIARILKDVLIRSEARFLMPITCWYTGMGFIALLPASRSEHLKDGANADLEILVLAIKQLKTMWGTAGVFEQTFDRLRGTNRILTPEDFPNRHLSNDQSTRALHSEEQVLQSGVDWMDYFPFVTPQTSIVAEKLLAQKNTDFVFWTGLDESLDAIPNYQDFMEGLDGWVDPASFL